MARKKAATKAKVRMICIDRNAMCLNALRLQQKCDCIIFYPYQSPLFQQSINSCTMGGGDKPIEYSALKKSYKRRLEQKAEKAEEQKRMAQWDPRFDDACGKLDRKQFKQAYAFMDDIRRREKAQIAEQLDAMAEELSNDEEQSGEPSEFDYEGLLRERRKNLKKKMRSFASKGTKDTKRKFGAKRGKHTPASAC